MSVELADIKTCFHGTGPIASCFVNYEDRPQQLEMAGAIMNALLEDRHLIVEAGTGVGKSLAYLIPIIKHFKSEDTQRVVVSTYTKTLQRQLVENDLPFLKEHLFPELRYTLCLGSENYLCLRRLALSRQHGLFEAREEDNLSELLSWASDTETGLHMEIALPLKIWSKVSRESDLCHGRDCRFYNKCFYRKAKVVERKSQILVTNHHLFFANMASGWNVLPEFEAVVFDEGHEIERVASDYLGVEASNTRLYYLLNSIHSHRKKGILLRLGSLDAGRLSEIAALTERVRQQGERFFENVSEWLDGRKSIRVRRKGQFMDIITEHLDALREEIGNLADTTVSEEEKRDLKAIEERCRAFIQSLRITVNQELERYVYWAEVDGRRTRLVATPVETGSILREHLFDVISPVIITSATLSVRGSFSYISGRLGLEGTETLSLSSPFNYKKNVLLYIPENNTDPRADDYIPGITGEIEKILAVTGGRTLVLFTSYGMIEQVLKRIKLKGLRVLRQGDADSYSLIEAFKALDNTVLFGTYTFWQGIDIPGNDLQCVVITKLPFAVPTDPVVEARMEAISARGEDPFHKYQVPQAIITFKQGFGRLVRTATDKGIVAVLDTRIKRKAYGRAFIDSIPDVEITADIEALKDKLSHQW